MVLLPLLNVFSLHFLQSVIQCAHRVRKREIQIWQNMNGNDRVLWWAALNLCNTEILIWSPTLPLDPGSPISSIYLKVNFIPTENWNLQKLENSKKVPWNKIYFARGLVEIWFTLFIGLLHVCLLQRSSCNCIASQRRRPCNKSIYTVFLIDTYFQILNLILFMRLFHSPHLVACYTENYLIHNKGLLTCNPDVNCKLLNKSC